MIDIFAMLPCHAVSYHYAVQFIVNLKNGTWTGPARLIVSGRTLCSAWESATYLLQRKNRDIEHLSILRYTKLKNKDLHTPCIAKQIEDQKRDGLWLLRTPNDGISA